MLSFKTYSFIFDVGHFGFVLLLHLRPALLGSSAEGIDALVQLYSNNDSQHAEFGWSIGRKGKSTVSAL